MLFLNTIKAVLVSVWKHKSNKIFMNTSTYEDIILWKHLFLRDSKHNSKQSKYSKIHFRRLTFLRPMWAISAFVVLRPWSEKHIFRSEYIYGIFPFQKVKSSKISSYFLGCCFQQLFCTIRNGFYSKLNQKDFTCDFHKGLDVSFLWSPRVVP